MTRSEACELLGIPENASLTMAKAAYKILRQEATTEVQAKVLATAFNVFQGVLKAEGDQNKPSSEKSSPRAKPATPHPKATPNVPAAKSKPSNSLKTKSREVARRTSTAVAEPVHTDH